MEAETVSEREKHSILTQMIPHIWSTLRSTATVNITAQ